MPCVPSNSKSPVNKFPAANPFNTTDLEANKAAFPEPLQVSLVGVVLLSPIVVEPALPVSQKAVPPAAHGFHNVPFAFFSLFQSSKVPFVNGIAGAVVYLSRRAMIRTGCSGRCRPAGDAGGHARQPPVRDGCRH